MEEVIGGMNEQVKDKILEGRMELSKVGASGFGG